eukprot:scaffold674_cov130-Amphora_coffeaeformis.AAC.11
MSSQPITSSASAPRRVSSPWSSWFRFGLFFFRGPWADAAARLLLAPPEKMYENMLVCSKVVVLPKQRQTVYGNDEENFDLFVHHAITNAQSSPPQPQPQPHKVDYPTNQAHRCGSCRVAPILHPPKTYYLVEGSVQHIYAADVQNNRGYYLASTIG